jgi:hypothetical protein
MPLPDAVPKPAGSNIYHQLNSTKLGDLTNAEFAIVRDPLFLNDRSEDELRRLALIGLARQSISASSSGPIPNTGTVITATQSTTNVVTTLLEPAPGEVWQVTGGSITGTGISGNVCYHLLTANQSDNIAGGTDRAAAVLNVEYCATAGQAVLNEETPFGQIFIDENLGLYGQASGTFTSINWKISAIRVR